jgi:hypothetical protein
MQRRAFKRSATLLASALLGLPFLSFAGCGQQTDGPLREAVSGSVSLDGQPLPDGLIQLIPTSAREGTVSGAVVKDGKFSIERQKGLAPGEYRVVINSGGRGGDVPKPLEEAPGLLDASNTPKDLIPPQYNTNSTLKAEVKASAPNTFDFSLKTK